MHELKRQRILLGVSGGIAAYKAADLVRRLQDAGAEVRVVMTEAARHFVGTTTFQALSGHPVRCSLWDEAAEAAMGHIELARWATRVLVAPATANTLRRLAQGHANDLLSTLCLAAVAASLRPPRLAGRRILVSAGPTFEDIDPVRFLGNRSSGKMGFAVADAARRMGADVTLVAGPVSLPTPPGVTRIDVRRAAQMHAAVMSALPGQDAYIGAAAVADYAPAETLPQKLKKSGDSLTLTLVRTPDILADVAAHAARPRLVVGFAAETADLEGYARDKLHRKGLDLIAANDVSRPGQGFEADENALAVFWRDGRHDIGRGPKPRVAVELLELVAQRLEAME